MRSPGLYWIGAVDLHWSLFEQPRAREREGVVVRVEGMMWVGNAALIARVGLSTA